MRFPLHRSHDNCQLGVTYLFSLMYHGACVVAFINHYVHTIAATKFATDCWSVVCGLQVTVYELVLWLSTFVTDNLNVVHGLPVTVYMSSGCPHSLYNVQIHECLHDNTRLSKTCKRTGRH